jgi:hypothetical protein
MQNSAHYFARSQEKEPHDPLKFSPPTHPLLITYLFTMALDAYNAAVAAYNTPTPGPVLPKPNTTNLTVELRESVWGLLEDDEPKNTRKAMEPEIPNLSH